MEYIIIKLENGRYFQTFGADNFLRSTCDPLEATRYIIREVCYEQEELNEALNRLDDEGVKYTKMSLSYSVREL